MPKYSSRHYLSILKKIFKQGLKSGLVQISSMILVVGLLIAFIVNILQRMIIYVPSKSASIVTYVAAVKNDSEMLAVISLSVSNNRHAFNKQLIDTVEDSTCFVNPSYQRKVIFVEHEIAPITIEVEVSIPESRYLSASKDDSSKIEVDSGFVFYRTYKDSDNKIVKELPLSEKSQRIVYNMSQKYGLPYKVVLALIGVETTWDEDTTYEIHGGVKYIGIGCLNEKYHAKNLAEKGIDIYTLEGNIEGICYLLRGHLDRFDGSITYAVMAYNGGAGYALAKKADGVTENSYLKKLRWYMESFAT